MKIIWTFTLLMIPGVVSAMNVTGYSGGGVKFTCKFAEKYKTNAKYFCKGDQWPGCSDLIRTNETDKWVNSGRFSLYDNRSASVLKVTIRYLREEDSGTYQCAFDRTRGKDSSTEVNLKVLTGQQNRSVRGYSKGNVNISLKYEMKDKNHVKVCKYGKTDQCVTVINTTRRAEGKHDRRFSVYNDRSAGLLLLFIRDLNENDSGKYRITVKFSENYSFFSEFNLDISDGSSLIVPLVLVPLVLIFAGLLLVFLCKKRHSRGGDSSSQTGPGKNEVVSHTGCAHKELPTNPSDSSDTVYATAQLPTNPSDSSNTDYATAQLPTSCITSSEDLNYAVVNFHKKSDCPDSVSFRNNQDYSEYAAVNHLTA
ncbi:unnamed protein product [Leuciscus chuanchicus]